VTDGITIRLLTTQADYAACVALQRDTWGAGFNETVPPSLMLVFNRIGGVVAGAFDEGGSLLGFVLGMTGVENGVIVHWSDMLAVRPEARNTGLGRRLKEFQRREVERVGGRVIYWTYDPLVARNAHLNFNVFGVRAVEYIRDMYGSGTGSTLHGGLGTDRLVVAWPVADADIAARLRETQAALAAPPARRIEIPSDLERVLKNDPGRAAEWRATVRREFEAAHAGGFRVAGFRADPSGPVGVYVLSRP